MAQKVKVLIGKPDDLSPSPRVHMGGESSLLGVTLDFLTYSC